MNQEWRSWRNNEEDDGDSGGINVRSRRDNDEVMEEVVH